MISLDQSQIKCVNCQEVALTDGSKVWVCQNCGTENPAVSTAAMPITSTSAEPMEAISPVPPVIPASIPDMTMGTTATAAPTVPITPATPAAPAVASPLDPNQVQPLQ
ncbi:hypothetical protein A2634_03055 [Candidatus Amesbacteria bacterium RIFCSPHIGHO2_01_FULL_48_32]|uniref:Uncharacterized protein n=1 Tax=Candidatus Amesbacteria bacterium RIFCSPLOWO2_01_FULL_48_25 TaxID=1797259 RepID=A0A1F4ZBG9_9BACT|nr:MAG: hypothetical protein A2634_03055 [Candidatus Amesbacteria bacterium RIFCSPHIGHO2_01_FULL_48_32]OGD03612.1 MAG: hypothetical protein A2989_02935 [Candidatus Amesbacteria bacterium RIFCSPLOWO2_01_FULL_48_25]